MYKQHSLSILLLLSATIVSANTVNTPNQNNDDQGRTIFAPAGVGKAPEGDSSGYGPIPYSEPLPKLVSDEVIKDVIENYPDVALRIRLLNNSQSIRPEYLPKQLLLVGQPGVSKTTIATVLAHVLKRKVAFFQGASLVGDQFQNSGIKRIEETLGRVLREITQNPNTKYIIVIDEFMRVVEDYKKEQGEGKRIATLVWHYIDRYKDSGQVFFVATANTIKELPAPLKSRFNHDIITIDVPSAVYRKKILTNFIGSHGLPEEDLNALVAIPIEE